MHRQLSTDHVLTCSCILSSCPKRQKLHESRDELLRFSEFLGRGTIPGSIEAAESSDAIGGYRSGLTIAELDESWPNIAVRDARLRDPTQEIGSKRRSLKDGWPLVIFSHGSGAYRASYIFFTEFLASQGRQGASGGLVEGAYSIRLQTVHTGSQDLSELRV